jgi:hypothetical protein
MLSNFINGSLQPGFGLQEVPQKLTANNIIRAIHIENLNCRYYVTFYNVLLF